MEKLKTISTTSARANFFGLIDETARVVAKPLGLQQNETTWFSSAKRIGTAYTNDVSTIDPGNA